MAFDQRLDSDYVDLNLGSWLSLIPVVGSAMSLWRSSNSSSISPEDAQEEPSFSCSLHRASTENNEDGSVDLPALESFASALSSATSLGYDESNNDGDTSATAAPQITLSRTRRKELSWTDTSGRGDLCQYFSSAVAVHSEQSQDESSVAASAPQPGSLEQPAPPPPTLMKSNSVRTRLEGNSNNMCSAIKPTPSQPRKHSYLPRMDPGTSGIVMPSMYSSGTVVGGNESPQYGFYVNLTPPSPSLGYCKNYSATKNDSSSLSSLGSTDASSTSSQGSSHYKGPVAAKPVNPVFQGLLLHRQQQGNSTSVVNFPAAPL